MKTSSLLGLLFGSTFGFGATLRLRGSSFLFDKLVHGLVLLLPLSIFLLKSLPNSMNFRNGFLLLLNLNLNALHNGLDAKKIITLIKNTLSNLMDSLAV